jgi:hypothetical protein
MLRCRLPTAAVPLCAMLAAASTSALFDPAQARQPVDSIHPWPQPYHDARRTSRTSVVGPQSATVKNVHHPPSQVFYFDEFADITVGRSGRAFVPTQYCIPYPEGCLGFYNLLALLRPGGSTRFFPGIRPQYYGAPVIADDGTLYTGNGAGLVALTPLGTVKWSYAGAGSPTLGADGTIYTLSGSRLLALNPSGMLMWSAPLPNDPMTQLAIGPDGSFYYGSVDRHLTALSSTGEFLWRFFTGDQMHSPPAIADDGTVYAGGNKLFALAPDGTLRWNYTSSGMSFSGTTPAVGSDGGVHFSAPQGVVALNADGTERWTYPLYEGTRRLLLDGEGTLYSGWSASIYNSGFLAIGSSGQLKWSLPITYPDTVSYDPALALGSDGTLYGATSYKVFVIAD